ncbi:cyclin-dependent kinase 4 inhibitor C [Gastrophryne carolinensis]
MAHPLPADLMATAAARGDLERLQELLQSAPDVDAPNRFGRTALQVSRLGCPAVIRLLLERGADPNQKDRCGFSVLHDAARAGFCDTMKILLDFNADVTVQTNEGNTVLHLAAMEGHLPMVQLLILHMDSLAKCRNRNGDTAFDLARMYNRGQVAEWLRANAPSMTRVVWMSPLSLSMGPVLITGTYAVGHEGCLEILLSPAHEDNIVDLSKKGEIACFSAAQSLSRMQLLLVCGFINDVERLLYC